MKNNQVSQEGARPWLIYSMVAVVFILFCFCLLMTHQSPSKPAEQAPAATVVPTPAPSSDSSQAAPASTLVNVQHEDDVPSETVAALASVGLDANSRIRLAVVAKARQPIIVQNQVKSQTQN